MKSVIAFLLCLFLFVSAGKAQILNPNSQPLNQQVNPPAPQGQQGWAPIPVPRAQQQLQDTIQMPSQPPPQQASIGWMRVPLDTNLGVAVYYPSRDTLYAQNDAAFYRSVDGGASFHRTGTLNPFFISFANALHGFGAAYTGHTAYRTSDGGQSWDSSDDQHPLVGQIIAVTADTAFISGDAVISRTTDAGKTWTPSYPNAAYISGISFANSKSGVVVGYVQPGPDITRKGAGCFTTTDGGTNWVQQFTGIPLGLTSVGMIDSLRIVAVGFYGTIAISSNGGKTWDSVQSGVHTVDLEAVAVHGLFGIAVGAKGTILATTDGGHSWRRENSGVSADLYFVRMIDDSDAIASGGGGTILKTANGGKDWIETSMRIANGLSVQVFPQPSRRLVTFSYTLPTAQHVTATIYDIQGKLLRTLLTNELQQVGDHLLTFESSSYPHGVYTYELRTEKYSASGKFTLVK